MTMDKFEKDAIAFAKKHGWRFVYRNKDGSLFYYMNPAYQLEVIYQGW